MTIEGNDLLMSSGVPAAFKKDTPVDTVVKGTVVSMDVLQQRSYDTDEPLFWDDGKPRQQLRIILDTADGPLAVYAKQPSDCMRAVRDAVRDAGAGKIDAGGVLAVQFVGTDEPRKPGMNGQKLFRAQYQPPSIAAGNDLLSGTPAQPAPVAEDLF